MRFDIEHIEKNWITISTSEEFNQKLLEKECKEVELDWVDPTRITRKQQTAIHSILKEIAGFMNEDPRIVKEYFKCEYLKKKKQSPKEGFSFSTCSQKEASEVLDFLIFECIQKEIPMETPLYKFCMEENSIEKYVYTCATKRVCAVSGQQGAELYPINLASSLNEEIKVIPLTKRYADEMESIGISMFLDLYHLCGIPLTENIRKSRGYTYGKR